MSPESEEPVKLPRLGMATSLPNVKRGNTKTQPSKGGGKSISQRKKTQTSESSYITEKIALHSVPIGFTVFQWVLIRQLPFSASTDFWPEVYQAKNPRFLSRTTCCGKRLTITSRGNVSRIRRTREAAQIGHGYFSAECQARKHENPAIQGGGGKKHFTKKKNTDQ